MKKIIISGKPYWYNPKLGFLFYDFKMTKQVVMGIFNAQEHASFLEQIARKETDPKTLESLMLKHGKVGEVFFSMREDRLITAAANYYKRTVTTERMLLVSSAKAEPTAEYITKVTLTSNLNSDEIK
jgi:hypothetical protein